MRSPHEVVHGRVHRFPRTRLAVRLEVPTDLLKDRKRGRPIYVPHTSETCRR